MARNFNVHSNSFQETLTVKGKDFKKIINDNMTSERMHTDSNFAAQTIDAKMAMDFYEDVNREAELDNAE